MNMMKRLLALTLTLLLLLPSLSGAEGTEKDGWHFDEKGFLTGSLFRSDHLLIRAPGLFFLQKHYLCA